MEKVSFTLTGENVIDGITKFLVNRGREGESTYHHFETGSSFTYHEVGISELSSSMNVFVDFQNFNEQNNTLKVVVSIIGNNGIFNWKSSKRLNTRLIAFHQDVNKYCSRYNWSLGELTKEQ